MSDQSGGPTLEDPAQRLEALTEKLGGLERENAELRNEVVALRGSDTRRTEPAQTRSLVPRRDEEATAEFEGVVSRRALLSKAGAAAVAAMAAGTLLYPRQAKAHDATAGITPDFVDTHKVKADNHIDGGPAVSAEVSTDLASAVEGVNNGPASGYTA